MELVNDQKSPFLFYVKEAERKNKEKGTWGSWGFPIPIASLLNITRLHPFFPNFHF